MYYHKLLTSAACIGFWPIAADAVVYSWNNASGGIYHLNTNWTPTGIPLGNNDAVFPPVLGDNIDVSVGTNLAVRSIRFEGAGSRIDFGDRSAFVGQIYGGASASAAGEISNGTVSIGSLALGGGATFGTAAVTLTNLRGLLGTNTFPIDLGRDSSGGTLTIRNQSLLGSNGGLSIGISPEAYSRTRLNLFSGSELDLSTTGLGLNNGVIVMDGGSTLRVGVVGGLATFPDQANVNIIGTATRLICEADLRVGRNQFGDVGFDARDGGLLSVAGSLQLGLVAGAKGTVSATRAGSKIDINGQVVAGSAGRGIVFIANGGYLSSGIASSAPVYQGAGVIGRDAGSVGTISILGAGSRWDANGPIAVGLNGEGYLHVSDSAAAVCASADIGSTTAVRGLARVDSNATWSILGDLVLGDHQAGEITNSFLELETGGTASVGGNTRVNPNGNIAIDLGRLDILSGAFLHDFVSNDPTMELTANVASAYTAGAWTGPGITSSAAALDQKVGIAIVNGQNWPQPEFIGEPVDATSVLLRVTLTGDTNADHLVNINDFAVLASNFNLSGAWRNGDFNYNGIVNIGDFAALAANFNQIYSPTISRVPEGGSTVFALLAVMRANRRARRGSAFASPRQTQHR